MNWNNQINYIDMNYDRENQEFIIYVDNRRQKKLKLFKAYELLFTRGYTPFLYKSSVLTNNRQIYLCILKNRHTYSYFSVGYRDNDIFYVFNTNNTYLEWRGLERFNDILYEAVLDDNFKFYIDNIANGRVDTVSQFDGEDNRGIDAYFVNKSIEYFNETHIERDLSNIQQLNIVPEPVIDDEKKSNDPEPVIDIESEVSLEDIYSLTDRYIKQLERDAINKINSLTHEDIKKPFDTQIGNILFGKISLINHRNREKRDDLETRLNKIYKDKQEELKRYSRKFILLARHTYNKFFEADSQCPICCEEYGDISRLNITICGHAFCKDCLYKNPNHLCPICKEVIEKI
jgi:hypothetical protein